MRVESALYASSLGMQANGAAISVVGDNISNANTTAFKESRIEFGDLVPEGDNGHQSTSTPNLGSGVEVSAVRSIFADGELENTSRQLDVAIDGNGFFITGDASDPVYSRAGNLTIDANGILATANGQFVLGFQGTGTTLGQINMKNISTTSSPTTKVSITGNFDTTTVAGTPPSGPATFNAIGANPGTVVSTISVYDSQGVSHDITVATTKTGINTWVSQAYIDGGDVTGGTAGVPKQLGQNTTLNFESNGAISATNAAKSVISASPISYSNGAAAGNVNIDLSTFTQFGAQSSIAGITKDGTGSGQVEGYTFARDGTITAQLSSGSNVVVGKLQLADFANRDGLLRAGNSGYKATTAAGPASIGNPGENGLGATQSGSLERSTVDIAGQFVNLIVYQRGYQANSQTLNVANEVIKDTLGLIR